MDRKEGWSINFAELINNTFIESGYKMIEPKLINSADYGVPQLRSRVFFVGNRMGKDFDFPLPSQKRPGLRKIITPSLHGAMEINLNNFPYLKDAKKHGELHWVDVPEDVSITGKPHKWLIKSASEGLISWDVRKSPHHVQVLNLDKPSKTIHSGYARMPRLFVLLKKANKFYIRMLTVDELKQIQSFPKNFKFDVVSDSQAIKQIGNAVPGEVVRRIVNSIKEQDDYFK